MTLERVYAVWDYWDGIRSGFADFRGSPHYFAATWEESSDDHAPVFTLVPVSRHTIELVSNIPRSFFGGWRLFTVGT